MPITYCRKELHSWNLVCTAFDVAKLRPMLAIFTVLNPPTHLKKYYRATLLGWNFEYINDDHLDHTWKKLNTQPYLASEMSSKTKDRNVIDTCFSLLSRIWIGPYFFKSDRCSPVNNCRTLKFPRSLSLESGIS